MGILTEDSMSKTQHAQKIISFFCRPCGAYHYKDHPHYRAMKQRAAKRRKAAAAATQQDAQSHSQQED
jgi:hypothetical protein